LRRWPHRILVTVNLFTLMCLVSVGAVYGYAKFRLGQIKVINDLPFAHKSAGSGLGVMNILLVGDNSRVGLSPAEAAQFGTSDDAGGAHSDVTMILHLDPSAGTASLLSIPRDLFVPLPPTNISGSVGKIDSALNGSNQQFSDGAAQLITTIQNDLGIPITNYVEINFDGFQRTVNALGGINMDFPDQLFDMDSQLRIYATGCLHLSGHDALALVRSRHLQYFVPGDNPNDPRYWPQEAESDLARIERDHTFLQVFAASVTSEGLTANVAKINGILGALVSQVTVDPQLKDDLIQLIERFRKINLATIPTLTMPVSVVPDTQYHYNGGVYGQVDFPVQPVDRQVVAQWLGSSPALVSSSSLTVRVRNISNVTHEAANTVAGLNALGFNAVDAGEGTIPADSVETLVRYAPGATGLAQGQTVVESLAGAVMMMSDPTVSPGTVDVDTGTSMSVLSAADAAAVTTTAPAPVAGSVASTTTTTVVATPGGQPVSSAVATPTSYDPSACRAGQPVVANKIPS
jgi:LCP family protein required for cell wall assembly